MEGNPEGQVRIISLRTRQGDTEQGIQMLIRMNVRGAEHTA